MAEKRIALKSKTAEVAISGASSEAVRTLDAFRSGTTKSVNAALLERLRHDLVTGEIPAGAKLKIPDICERFAVSPGAAREALSRLVPEGLVDFIDQRGFRSPPVTVAGLQDITRVRLLIEREALIDSMRHGDGAWESEILAAQHRLLRCDRKSAIPYGSDPAEWTARHKEFHQALIAACTSPWLIRMHNMLYDQTERYRAISARAGSAATGPKRDVKGEHSDIADAVIARNEAEALRLMQAHLKRTADRVLAIYTGQ
jgi:DNA-binding GntR family transcriptional regulator